MVNDTGEKPGAALSIGDVELVDHGPDVKPSLPSMTVRDLTTRVLDFLSDASHESLAAVLVGLGAVTYFILGRVGLLLIGVIGGVVWHATWEGHKEADVDDEPKMEQIERRREKGFDIVRRALDGRDRPLSSSIDQNKAVSALVAHRSLDFSGFPSETASALTDLVDAIVRDYVKWWYLPIVPQDQSFPEASRQTLVAFFLSISSHLSRKRPADTFLDFLTNASSILIVFLTELSTALSASSNASDPADAVHQYLEDNPDSNLANILDLDSQRKKLETVAEEVLQRFLDPRAYSCEPVRLFLKEILGRVVLEMTVQACSRPDWLNGWIVYLLEDGEPELMSAIDAGMGGDDVLPKSRVQAELADGKGHVAGKGHKRRLSKAEGAMQEAMQEAKRLNALIAEDDARRADRQSMEAALVEESPRSGSPGSDPPRSSQTLTNFDQIVPDATPTPTPTTTALQVESDKPRSSMNRSISEALTLYEAKVAIFDDGAAGEKGNIRSRPTIDYLLQIEPASASHPGWMIARKYADLETLHEVLRRISKISGVTGFTQQHESLPGWKGSSKASLREGLEQYLCNALSYRPLAESEGMKRFLEKDQGQSRSPQNSSGSRGRGVGWPNPASFETISKGMLDVLASAPKGAAGGGKAIVGGVSGAIGAIGSIGQKKATVPSGDLNGNGGRSSLYGTLAGSDTTLDRASSLSSRRLSSRPSQESLGNGPSTSRDSSERESRAPTQSSESPSTDKPVEGVSPDSASTLISNSTTTTTTTTTQEPPSQGLTTLPPLPSEIPDDYGTATPSLIFSTRPTSIVSLRSTSLSLSTDMTASSPTSTSASVSASTPTKPPATETTTTTTTTKQAPLTEAETRLTLSLLFALITTLYNLSSAWSIRLTLLSAAKSYLLRPSPNPHLDSIRRLLQESVLDAQTSDAGIARHLRGVISSVFAGRGEVVEQSKSVPGGGGEYTRVDEHHDGGLVGSNKHGDTHDGKNDRREDGTTNGGKDRPDEKVERDSERERADKLRQKARRLLVERGMPLQLRGVMGGVASGEALGRVFDVLQGWESSELGRGKHGGGGAEEKGGSGSKGKENDGVRDGNGNGNGSGSVNATAAAAVDNSTISTDGDGDHAGIPADIVLRGLMGGVVVMGVRALFQ